MNELVKYANDTIEKYIRPATFPVAVRFFKEGEELPPKTKFPSKAFGNPITLCQCITLARRMGWTVGFKKEDQGCSVAMIVLGYVDEPDFVKDGSLCMPMYNETLEAGAVTQAMTPKMPVADTYCIVVCPLDKCDFEPDLILVYGSGAQIIRMVQGSLYKCGGAVESRFMGRAACGAEITTPLITDKVNVIIPGGGARVFALYGDDELSFAIPKSKIKDVCDGVIATHKGGVARMPTPFAGPTKSPSMPPYYSELEKYCGMK